MTEVVSVRFKNKGKVYYFDPSGLDISAGDSVIVQTAKGLEFAECSRGNHHVEETSVVLPIRPVVRIATDADKKRAAENKKKEAEAFVICQEKIIKHEMDMKLVDVEYNFEGNKILFFFTSDGRVDFRDLVKDLASVFKMRIELRQIGVRDEARMIGGLGICGKPFCCAQFLDEFQPVSIKMAKVQGLSLNPAKISGTCGRLMCCLKYEQEAYEGLVKKAPKVDAFVDTNLGKGSVISVNLLRGQAKVRLEDQMDTSLKTFDFDELEVLGGKAKRAEYIAAQAEKKEEAARQNLKPKMEHRHKQESKRGEARQKTEIRARKGDKGSSGAAGKAASEETKQTRKPDSRRRHRRGRGKGKKTDPSKKTDPQKTENKTVSKPKSE